MQSYALFFRENSVFSMGTIILVQVLLWPMQDL